MEKIVCNDIKKHFGGVKALQGAFLELKAGEIRALFGGNGSGKSTLAKILGGVIAPDSGKIFIDDQDAKINSPIVAKSLGIVVTSQELSLFDNLSVEDNIMFSVLPKKHKYFVDKDKIKESARLILEKLQISDISSIPVRKLQENKKYLLEFAKALAQEPKFLIVDEITSALFAQEFETIMDILFELSSDGIPIIFISHRMSEIYRVCHSVTVMRNGVTVGTYDLNTIDKEELLNLMTAGNLQPGESSSKIKVDSYQASIPKSFDSEANHQIVEKQDYDSYLLKLEDFHLKSFDKKINISVMPGEFIGLSGLQGQGQSELVRTIFGLNGPVNIIIKGGRIKVNSPFEAVSYQIAFISGDRQTEGVFPDRSVQENLDVVHDLIFSRGRINYPKIIKQLKIVIDSLRQPIKDLSGGNQQKVVIGRWVSSEPFILLADDPNKGVDVQARRDVHEIFKQIVETGATIIMASSDDEELVDISKLIRRTKILVFYNGSIIKILQGEDINVENIISASLSKGVTD